MAAVELAAANTAWHLAGRTFRPTPPSIGTPVGCRSPRNPGSRLVSTPLVVAVPRSTRGCTIGAMASVVKRTISVPADVFAAVEAEVTDDESLSSLFSEGARLLLRRRAGERAIAAYESERGPISQAALDEADRLLDGPGPS